MKPEVKFFCVNKILSDQMYVLIFVLLHNVKKAMPIMLDKT